MKYVIGSGWWCAEEAPWPAGRKKLGDDLIRSAGFHSLWYAGVNRFTDPGKILIVDSASPVRPPAHPEDPRFEVLSLDRNYGHAISCETRFSGYTRSCMLGVAYAWLCDADYFVYVEQDCLLYGEGILERAIGRMKHDFMFGDGTGTPQPLQQSLFIIARPAFRSFLDALDDLRGGDREVAPEIKFSRLRWDLPPAWVGRRQSKAWHKLTWRFWYDRLPFGYGRVRPLDWNQPHFYFQHGSREEVSRYCEMTGFPPPGP